MESLRDSGIKILRWWILAGGVNFPVGQNVFKFARRRLIPPTTPIQTIEKAKRKLLGQQPFFELELNPDRSLPALPELFLRDFANLASLHKKHGLLFIPSLLSFEFFQPAIELAGSTVKRGRRLFLKEPRLDDFLDATIEPLLDTIESENLPVYAFEVINEPEWAVRGGPLQLDTTHYGSFPTRHLVTGKTMDRFIMRALYRIVRRGLRASVGFHSPQAPWLAQESVLQLRKWAKAGKYIHQTHHYPTIWGKRYLPSHDELPIQPTLLGEFPTAMEKRPENAKWKDPRLARTETRPDRYLQARLMLIEELGYPGALGWGWRSTDSRSKLDENTLTQIRRFGSPLPP